MPAAPGQLESLDRFALLRKLSVTAETLDMNHGDLKRLLVSIGAGILLTASGYLLSYLLSRHQGIPQDLGYLIAVVLAFPLVVFFHDREAPIMILMMVALLDSLVLSLPVFIFLMAFRK